MGSCLLLMGIAPAIAQKGDTPPNVLVIQWENVKPGKAGAQHNYTESAFIQAMKAANWPTHYTAAESMSGENRALFFAGYSSFAAWEKDTKAIMANPTLGPAFDRAFQADGELLSSNGQSVYSYREDLSHPGNTVVSAVRYWEISRYKIKSGHEKDWNDLVKLYKDAYMKTLPDATWAFFESMYGADNGGVFLIFTPLKSLAEIDEHMMNGKKLMAAMGEDGMKKAGELSAACIESEQKNLFSVSPKLSYPDDSWVAADPAFWGGK